MSNEFLAAVGISALAVLAVGIVGGLIAFICTFTDMIQEIKYLDKCINGKANQWELDSAKSDIRVLKDQVEELNKRLKVNKRVK